MIEKTIMSMFPIYIVCHADHEPAGYLCRYLDKKNVSYKIINGISYDLAGLDLAAVAGLVFMGGRYSVNEELVWIADEVNLIQKALAKEIPLMGICFGAQLISKALGAEVHTAESMETGWHRIEADTSKLAEASFFNMDDAFDVFEWHEDVFSIPDGATRIFSGRNFENQGYLYGNVLAMQFHLEMTEQMVHKWLQRYQFCIPESSQYIQRPEQITENLYERLKDLHLTADNIYGGWLSMIKLS